MALVGNQTGAGTDRKMYQVFKGITITMPENGTASSIFAFIVNTVGTGATWGCAILDASGNLLDETSTRTDIGAGGWYEFTGLSEALTGSTDYILAIASDGVADDLGDSVQYQAADTYDGLSAAGDADNIPFPASITFSADSARDYQIYLNYTTGGGGGGNVIAWIRA